ncbi:putative leucine-rich repeat protein (LRRP) [Trypanosoma cruzi]|uniref:Leucine-rich repeat protein (LRRP) n=1 Tax=Trypanosoma cruzi TaxID=5693 RepID=A0A2V2W1W4_TRYCR|nr:hypothetical protein C4B63_4g104 [Trypanosoma cruzi]RNF19261.1 putative leucine-rich repeat protein (LRRP) [Trypanosoma cruzi]
MSGAGEGEQRVVASPLPNLRLLNPAGACAQGGADARRQRGNVDHNEVAPTIWGAAAAGPKILRRHYKSAALWQQFSPSDPQMPEECYRYQQHSWDLHASVPVARVQNVEFPFSSRFPDCTGNSLLSSVASSSKCRLSPIGTMNGKSDKFVPVGDVGSQDTTSRRARVKTSEDLLFRQSGCHVPLPEARVVHPQGFRILKSRSAVERSLRSYFRLPPAPSLRLIQERLRTQRQLLAVETTEDEEEARFFSNLMEAPLRQSHFLLDGYLLLCASGQPEPEAVEEVTLQHTHLVGVIEDDLTHFQNLRFLDVSENELLLEHLLFLTGLEVLHLPYNKIDSLAGVARVVMEQRLQSTNSSNACLNRGGVRGSGVGAMDSAVHGSRSIRSAAAYYAQEKKTTTIDSNDGVRCPTPITRERGVNGNFHATENTGYYSPHQKTAGRLCQPSECSMHDVLLPKLHALNLSFNKIPSSDILHLAYFPFLEKLDLSGNNLRVLPEDLADLTGVTHFALERNHFRDGNTVFAALSTMPALIEVNLNHNELRHVPPLSVKNGRGLCFPSIEVIGLGYNRFRGVRDVVALTELVRTLQRVMLAGNPIARKSKERGAAHSVFAQAVMNLYWEKADLQTLNKGEYSTMNRFSNDVPFEDTSMLHTRQQCKSETDNEKEMTRSEYHGLGSLISSWQRSRMPSGSKVSSRCQTEDFESEGDAAHLSGSVSDRPYTPFISPSAGGGSNINNLFWYGDAEPPPSRGTATLGHDGTLPELTTPLLLRFVELIFEDTVMKKQKPGYFCSKWRQTTMEIENQRRMTADGGHLPRLVHPKTGLVTLPNYNEFMDIYRLLEDPPLSRPGLRRRRYATSRGRRRRQMADIAVPKEAADDTKEEEMEKKSEEEREEVVTPKPVDMQSTGTEEEYEMDESSSERSVSPQDVVFMTGVPLQEECVSGPKKWGEIRPKKVVVQEFPVEDYRGGSKEGETPLPDPTEHANKREVKGQRGQQRRKQSEHSHERFPRDRKEQKFSSAVPEPPSTNVRILMNELRRMLRRPLPSLPSVSTKKGK